jgi:hypothetical protein
MRPYNGHLDVPNYLVLTFIRLQEKGTADDTMPGQSPNAIACKLLIHK